ncbi:hypothetical protein BDV39DRAFT_183165 [Aspergillus sergii]|uniref:Uncharacterized protein n=1 Tax=Aspergillus sergii TaxID=1034303 RepID=A0A5N6WQ20_9EURO|nr:hypothetical protein BDV39DRAFT_183165 [Aspergillus sergii]
MRYGTWSYTCWIWMNNVHRLCDCLDIQSDGGWVAISKGHRPTVMMPSWPSIIYIYIYLEAALVYTK